MAETPRYDAAVADLELVLAAGRGTLDTSTVRVLEEKLALIDPAFHDVERALAIDPGNPYLNAHLARTLRQKIDCRRLGRSADRGGWQTEAVRSESPVDCHGL
jgi:hypothetical protein